MAGPMGQGGPSLGLPGTKGNSGGGGSWLTPPLLLGFFCTCCLFIYLDRGMIASNGVNGASATPDHPASGIQGDFKLSLFQDGLLPAAFMVGLLVSSPIFAEASKHHNAFRLIGIGLAVWTAAAAGCGLSPGFVPLLLCRMAVGVGEASFVALAAPFIDDNAPPSKRALWLGLFYMCIPTGYAFGYIYGGIMGALLGWRAAFLLEAAAMLPFVLFCLRGPAINLRGTGDTSGDTSGGHHNSSSSSDADGEPGFSRQALSKRMRTAARAVAADLAVLARHPVYIWNVAGMTAYTAVLGAFAFYGPKAGRDVFDIAPERADITFGAITVATGTLGTLAGGMLLDAIGSSMRNALLLCTLGITAGAALAVLAFWTAATFELFAIVFAMAQLAMFMSQAPSNAVCMWSVPTGLRPFAMSMSVVAIHVLGDVPSPPLLGALQGHLQNWRLSMSLASSLLFLGGLAYFTAAITAVSAVDYRELNAAAEPMEDDVEGSSGGADGAGSGAGQNGVNGGAGGWADEAGGLEARHGAASPERPLLSSMPS